MSDPDNTVWVVVAHKRLPFPGDVVIGKYPTEADATQAWEHLVQHPQWFTTYTVERRLK
jgi:hypothetical protein